MKPIMLAARSKPNNLVQTIERTSLIIDSLGQNPHGTSIRDLSAKIKLPKGTTHRLLSSLSYFGYVRQDPKAEITPWASNSLNWATCSSVSLISGKRPNPTCGTSLKERKRPFTWLFWIAARLSTSKEWRPLTTPVASEWFLGSATRIPLTVVQ